MAAAGQFFLIAPPGTGALELSGRHGKLQFKQEKAGTQAAFTVWDSFDGAIGSSGRLLVERGRKLHLLGRGGGVAQSARRNGNFLEDLRAGPVKDALAGLFPRRCLLPLAAGKLARASYGICWRQKRCGSLICWQFSGSFGSAALLELQAGGGARREKAAQWLVELGAAPAVPGDAYALLAPGRLAYSPKPLVRLAPAQPALEAAAAIIRACLAAARQNEPGIVSDLDTEFLHGYRISLRRIRSVLSLFNGVFAAEDTLRLKQAFAALMAPTGRLRDLDVYLLERSRFYGQLPQSLHPGLDAMFAAFEAERRDCFQALALHLAGARYKWQIAALQAEFAEGAVPAPGPAAERPALGFAQRLIWKRYRKLCRTAEGITPESPDPEVHALRISCKKLRYLMELFAPLFPARELKRMLKPLKRMQNTLGDFNDCSVQQAALLEFTGTAAATQQVALSAGALIAVLHRDQLAARAQVEEKFSAFNSPETQARFRAMFRI